MLFRTQHGESPRVRKRARRGDIMSAGVPEPEQNLQARTGRAIRVSRERFPPTGEEGNTPAADGVKTRRGRTGARTRTPAGYATPNISKDNAYRPVTEL